jgi:pyrroline-5-carboxylate reductase
MQLGFIGTGEITLSIVTGLSSSGVSAHSIWLSPRNSAVANGLANRFHGISVASCNQEVLDHSDTIVIAVLFADVGTVFPVARENEFDAICATTATIASYFAFNETIASWLERQGVRASQARDYIARLFLGVTTGAVEAPERSFQSLAATHATAGGINEQFLEHLVEHGLLMRVSEALDAVLHRIGAES